MKAINANKLQTMAISPDLIYPGPSQRDVRCPSWMCGVDGCPQAATLRLFGRSPFQVDGGELILE
jgi:hypothetical protein